jgi:hypothetical protein
VRELAAAIAEVLDVPLPAHYTAETIEQHRQVLMGRTLYVQQVVRGVADDRMVRTLADEVAYIRRAADRHPVGYVVAEPATV